MQNYRQSPGGLCTWGGGWGFYTNQGGQSVAGVVTEWMIGVGWLVFIHERKRGRINYKQQVEKGIKFKTAHIWRININSIVNSILSIWCFLGIRIIFFPVERQLQSSGFVMGIHVAKYKYLHSYISLDDRLCCFVKLKSVSCHA